MSIPSTNHPFMQLSLQRLREHSVQHYRQGGGSRPDVLVIDIDGKQAVLKDHNQCDRWFATLLGPLLVWREQRALTRASAISGIPRLYRRIGLRALLIEHCPGVPITRVKQAHDWQPFFASMSKLLDQMHQHGVAHCDLRSPTNILLTEDGKPVIVDFVASVQRGQRWNLIANWVFKQFSVADHAAIIKLKNHVDPALLTEAQRQTLSNHTGFQKWSRSIGIVFRKLSRWLFTK